MLNITKKADYGLLMLTSLANENLNSFIPLKQLASNQDLPYKFLSQIAIELKAGGIIESKEGFGGGYRLKRPAKNISISEILTLLEGPIAPMACFKGKACKHAPDCGHRKIMERLTTAFNKTLSAYSLANLSAS